MKSNADNTHLEQQEITRGCTNQPQESQKKQQESYAAVIKDKEKRIKHLQQELKVRDDHYIQDLRRQEEELHLRREKMEDQNKTLTKVYREELAEMESDILQEIEMLLTTDKTKLEKHTKEYVVKELESLTQRMKKVEEYEYLIQNLMLEDIEKRNIAHSEYNEKCQVLERDTQQKTGTWRIMSYEHRKDKHEEIACKINLAHIKKRNFSQESEKKIVLGKYSSLKCCLSKGQFFSEGYKRIIQQYERIKTQIKHFASVNVRKSKGIRVILDKEINQLLERALVIDSLICKKLDIAWERSPVLHDEGGFPIDDNTLITLEAYWESLVNMITEDKLTVWDTAERTLMQYNTVLKEICEFQPKTQRLEQQNREMRGMLLNNMAARSRLINKKQMT